jgi:hypothetical protein
MRDSRRGANEPKCSFNMYERPIICKSWLYLLSYPPSQMMTYKLHARLYLTRILVWFHFSFLICLHIHILFTCLNAFKVLTMCTESSISNHCKAIAVDELLGDYPKLQSHVMLRVMKPAKRRSPRASRLISRSCWTVCILGINACHRYGCYRGLWKRLAIGNGIMRTSLTMKLGRQFASSYVDTWDTIISILILDYMKTRLHWGFEESSTCFTINNAPAEPSRVSQ